MARLADGDLICNAARDGDLSHVSQLVSRGISPNARESLYASTPLHWSGQARAPHAAQEISAATLAARSRPALRSVSHSALLRLPALRAPLQLGVARFCAPAVARAPAPA